MNIPENAAAPDGAAIYAVNPRYRLRRDGHKVIVFNRSNDPVDPPFIGFVHPFYAILLAFFDGKRTLDQATEDLEKLLRTGREKIRTFLAPLLENPESVFLEYEGNQFSFPPELLIKASSLGNGPLYVYDPREFFINARDVSFTEWRLNAPLDLLFVVNTTCRTDCVYCYADRTPPRPCGIPLERIGEIIREARRLGMRAFDISGGELFLYEHWEALIAELIAHGFTPFISTKYPVDETTIRKLKDLGVDRLQISLDSADKAELAAMLRVSGEYAERLIAAPELLDRHGMAIYVNTQVNAYNTDSMDRLIQYLTGLRHIRRMNFGAAGFSLYRGAEAFNRYRAPLSRVKKAEALVNEAAERFKNQIFISFSGYMEEPVGKSPEERESFFWGRSRCSGNFYSLVILPDGKATICEELYWLPRFIVGDIMKQSIMEIWQSEQALDLYHLSRHSPAFDSASPCRECEQFEPCRKRIGVCWKEIAYAYGFENWHFPDPKCPKAPPFHRRFFIE